MILLSRLRLINWHNFADDLLDIQQITYLIGVNGVGKTTILDALLSDHQQKLQRPGQPQKQTDLVGLGTRQAAGSG